MSILISANELKNTDHLEQDLETLKRVAKQIETKIEGRVKKIIYQNTMLKKHVPMLESFRNKIKLDVGGEIFCTTYETLMKEKSYFEDILGEGFEAHLDPEDGSYLIERSPEFFPYVLEFMRTGSIISMKKLSKDDKVALLADAEFYKIEGLINFLTGKGGKKATGDFIDGAMRFEFVWDSSRNQGNVLCTGTEVHQLSGSGNYRCALGKKKIPTDEPSFWELKILRLSSPDDYVMGFGIADRNINLQTHLNGGNNNAYCYFSSKANGGKTRYKSTSEVMGASDTGYAQGDIVGFYCNPEEKFVQFYVNGMKCQNLLHRNVDFTQKLYPAVQFLYENDSVEWTVSDFEYEFQE